MKRDATYASLFLLNTPAAIRTRDLQLRRLTLYPAELRVRASFKIHHAPIRVNARSLGMGFCAFSKTFHFYGSSTASSTLKRLTSRCACRVGSGMRYLEIGRAH